MTSKKEAKKELNKIEVVKKEAKKLLSLIGSKAEVEVTEDKENQAVLVNIKTQEETGLLIGRHGETVLSIQTILGMVVKNVLGEWIRIIVNVGDWREKEETHLRELAEQTAERAKETGEPQYLYNLSSAQRRIIHLSLSEDPEVETVSEGEGKERFLIIRKNEASVQKK